MVGIPVRLLMGRFAVARLFCDPWIAFFRFIPPIAFVALAAIRFGPGEVAAPAEALRAEGHEEKQVRRNIRAVGGAGFNVNLFPNLGCSAAFFRVLQPVSVDEAEVRRIALGMEGGPRRAASFEFGMRAACRRWKEMMEA